MSNTIARLFHSGFTTTLLYFQRRGEHNYSVTLYNIDNRIPEAAYSGGIEGARESWAKWQSDMIRDGFTRDITATGGEACVLLESMYPSC